MKSRTKVFWDLSVLTIVIVLLVWPASRFISSSRDYGQAEPLVEIIWPMAREMKRFTSERGRTPNSLDEISRFSSDYDFTKLRDYRYEFSTTGSKRFYLRVNDRFAFMIDEYYEPHWISPAAILSGPINSK